MAGDTPLHPAHPAADVVPLPARRAPRPSRSAGRESPARRPPAADAAVDSLDEARIAEFRARIAAGVYDSREVAEEVARRLLESGDL